MTYNEIKAELQEKQKQLDSFHAFFEDFNKYDLAISLANSHLMDLYSEIITRKVSNKSDSKLLVMEKSVNSLLHIMTVFYGLNSKCQDQKLRLKNYINRCDNLEKEIKSMKDAFNQPTS